MKKLGLIAMALLVALASSVAILSSRPSTPVAADMYDDQIAALQAQIAAYQQQANQLAQQAISLQQTLDQINNSIATIQTQIDLYQAQYDQLSAQITDTKAQIKQNQDALGKTIADLYVDDQVSTAEMLFGSNNLADYMNKQEYRSSIRDQLTATVKKNQELEAKLSKQQASVKVILDDQNAQKDALSAQQQAQASLLAKTNNNEKAYQNMVAQAQAAIASATAAQRAYYASLGGNTSAGSIASFQYKNLYPSNGAGGCSGGYPYCGKQDSMIDPWQLYNRECVSYVAWALVNRFHKVVHSFNGEGNAYEWAYAHAERNVGSAIYYSGAQIVTNPQPGDVVVLNRITYKSFSPIGHVMIVESVDGDWLHVSQFNFYGTGQYSSMDVKNPHDSSTVTFLRFPSAWKMLK